MACNHAASWQWELHDDPNGGLTARRMTCKACHAVMPIGDAADQDVDVRWEMVALNVAVGLRFRMGKESIDEDLIDMGLTQAEVDVFWIGVKDAACGDACLTIKSVLEAMPPRREDGEAVVASIPNGAIAYAAGVLAQRCAGEIAAPKSKCVCATDTVESRAA